MKRAKRIFSWMLVVAMLTSPLGITETEDAVEPVAVEELAVEPVEEPVVEPATEPTAEPTAEPAAEVTAEPVEQDVPEPDLDVTVPEQPEAQLPVPPVVAPGADWRVEGEGGYVIPCAADAEKIEIVWTFGGEAEGFALSVAPAAEPEARTELGFVEESRAELPVAAFGDGWQILYIAAVLADGAQVEGAQAIRVERAAAQGGDVPAHEAGSDNEIADEVIEIEVPTLAPEAEATPAPTAEPLPAEAMAAELGVSVEELAADLGVSVEELYLLDEAALNDLYMQVHVDEYGIMTIAESDFEIDSNGCLKKYNGTDADVTIPGTVKATPHKGQRSVGRNNGASKKLDLW